MKKILEYKKLLTSLLLLLVIVSCGTEPDEILFKGPHIVSFARSNAVVNENAASGTVSVIMSRTFSEDVIVSFSVKNENAVEDIDYTLDETTVVIPAGQYKGTLTIIPIDNDNFDAARTVTLTITDISEPSLRPSADKFVSISILNDDCPVNTSIWAGEIESTEYYSEGDPYGPFSVSLSPNAAGDCDLLEIDNIGNFAGDKLVTITFTPDEDGATFGTVSIARQGIGTYGSSGERTVQGSGTYDETTKKIQISLVYYFGDGSVYYETDTEFIGN